MDDRFHDVSPEYAAIGDAGLAGLRVIHLLTMSGGLLYEEVGGTNAMTQTRNRILWVIQQPMDSALGGRYRYSGGLTKLRNLYLYGGEWDGRAGCARRVGADVGGAAGG